MVKAISNIAILIGIGLLISSISTHVSAIDTNADTTKNTTRVLLEQTITLSNHPMNVTVWVDHRQLYQQQALQLHITVDAPISLGKITAEVRATTQNDWTPPSLLPITASIDNNKTHYEWQMELFAKHDGIVSLPNMQLLFTGNSMAKKWLSLPTLTVRVLPLPFYLPASVIIGQSITIADHHIYPAWNLVNDTQMRQLIIDVEQVQPNTLVLPKLTGQGIQGLSPVIQQQDHRITITQAWRITESGNWQAQDQHLWLFNPETLKTTHFVIAGISGIAIPIWLWHSIQGVMIFIGLMIVIGLSRLINSWLTIRHHRQRILQCQDAAQLISYLKQINGYPNGAVLAQVIANTHPHYDIMMQLEGMLFNTQPLYGTDFEQLREKISHSKQSVAHHKLFDPITIDHNSKSYFGSPQIRL